MEYRSKRIGGNEFAKFGNAAFFAPIILIAPFPTLNLAHEEQKGQMMLSGGYYVRNVFAFFAILALFTLFRINRLRTHLIIILPLFSYLAI